MIRPFITPDKEALVEVFKLNIPRYFDPKEVNDYAGYLDKHGDTYLTIEHENKIVGGTGYIIHPNEGSGHITWIFFHPAYAGQGLGKEAVEYCMNIFKNDPAVVKLVVRTSQFANRFFEKFGYQLIKTEKDYWGQGLDLYLMEQQLK